MIHARLRRRLKGLFLQLPGMITCQAFDAFIVDYLDGALPDPQRRLFERHLGVCAECRAYLAAYRATIEAVRLGLIADQPGPHEVPEDLVKAVVAARGAGEV